MIALVVILGSLVSQDCVALAGYAVDERGNGIPYTRMVKWWYGDWNRDRSVDLADAAIYQNDPTIGDWPEMSHQMMGPAVRME